ncbi:P-loop containing nucleoside triphosphate hydrolase protein [Mrakia frigida]|uniref:Yfh7p n=1 Tax=Mrakia frigida TaxID=29902 RepID=UPI003FCC253C
MSSSEAVSTTFSELLRSNQTTMSSKSTNLDIKELVEELAQKVVQKFKDSPSSERLLVGVAGVPGSGKSTLAVPLAERINRLLDSSSSSADKGKEPEIAVCVGMDGWHCTRAELDLFEDPAEARRRRGAHHTFNSTSFLTFLSSLRVQPTPDSAPLHFPTFSHELKDPSPSPFPIYAHNKIVVIEGLYLFLDLPPWNQSKDWWSLKIWLDVPAEMARTRLVNRHLQTGIEASSEDAERRVDGSDMLNGEAIKDNLIEPDVVVLVREVDGVVMFGIE